MHRTALVALALSSLSSLAPRTARADIVEPGFVETCTLERVQADHAGQSCIACGTFFGEATRCDDELREGGYAQVCRSSGASVWTQIGCRAATADTTSGEATPPTTATPPPAPTPPAPTPPATAPASPAAPVPATESSSGCAAGAHAPSAAGVWLAIASLGFVFARRRARR